MASAEPFLQTVGWLGGTWGYWIQTVAFLMSGLAAIGAIFFSAIQIWLLRTQLAAARESSDQQQKLLLAQLAAQEKHSQHRATVEVVRHEQTDKELLEAFKGYAMLREDNSLIRVAATHPEPLDEHSKIMRVLNNYEYVSVGILVGAFNEEIYKRMKRSALIRDWDALCPYVYHLRQKYGKRKLYVELETLATRWKDD